MTRWSEQFENHPIHETLKRLHQYADTKLKDLTSEVLSELRRFKKILDLIDRIMDTLDPDFFPMNYLNELNNNLTSNVVNQMSKYSSGNVESLKEANDYISDSSELIYRLLGMVKQPRMRELAKSYENSFDSFAGDIQKKNNEFVENLKSNTGKLEKLQEKTNTLDKMNQELESKLNDNQEIITQEHNALKNQWNKEFTAMNQEIKESAKNHIENFKTQNEELRNEFSENQKERTEEFSKYKSNYTKEAGEAVREIKNLGDTERKNINDKHDEKFKKLFNTLSETMKKKEDGATNDMEQMRANVRKIYELFGEESVATGYQRSAQNEKKVADLWRNISLGFYALILIWVIADVLFFLLWAYNSENPEIFEWSMVSIVASIVSIPAFAAAQFASRQSKLHRKNEVRLLWFALETTTLDPFISSLLPGSQEKLKMELTGRLFGQDHNIDDKPKSTLGTFFDVLLARFTASKTE